MEEMLPNNIDGIHINIEDGRRVINMPPLMTGEQFGKWKKSRGGIFSKDVFRWIRGEDHGNYVLLEGEGKKLILRLIEDENLEDFKILKLVQGRLVDKFYMKFKDLSDPEEENGYINENDQEDITLLEDSMTINSTNIPHEDDAEAGSGKSLSLFND